MKGYRIRQVYDLPPIQIEVTEHKVEQKNAHIAILSKNPSFLLLSLILYNMVEYKRLIPYLTHYQCISLKRTKEFFQDCFGHSISEGTLVNHTQAFASQLQLLYRKPKRRFFSLRLFILMKPVCE